jgi:hypothetical protein
VDIGYKIDLFGGEKYENILLKINACFYSTEYVIFNYEIIQNDLLNCVP